MSLSFVQSLTITGKAREDWYRALAKTAKDGQGTLEVIKRMEPDFAKIKHPMTPLLREVMGRMSGGDSATSGRRTLGTELRGLVPSAESTLIHAGIEAGKAHEGLQNAAELLAESGKLRKSVLGALFLPGVQLAFAIGVLMFLSLKLLPRFEKSRPRVRWPSDAQALGVLADNAGLITFSVIGLVIGLGFFFAYIAPRWIGPRREWFDRHVFPFGIVASMNGSTLLTTLAGFVGAGMDFFSAVKTIQKNSNPYIAFQCERLVYLMKEGYRPEVALAQVSVIPARYHWVISVYGMSGDSADAFKKIAGEMVERTQALVNTLFSKIVNPLLMAVVAGLVLWIYSSLFGIAEGGSKRAALVPDSVIAAVVSSTQGVYS